MSLSTRPAHVARAALEAIALQIGDVLQSMEADLGAPLPDLLVDGGATRNPFLVQLLADLLDRRILRPQVAEASALGVARLAGLAIGLIQPDAGAREIQVFTPAMPPAEREIVRERWRVAIDRVTGRAG